MSRLIRYLDTTTTSLGPRRVEAIAGTSNKARDGHVVEMRGMDIGAFLRSGTVLFGHDQGAPVGTPISGRVDSGGALRLVIEFAPAGADPTADRVCNLVKAGTVRNLSIGFDVIEAEPLDPARPRGGLRVTRSELLEVSFVSVPADVDAVVTARSARAGKVFSAENAGRLRQAHDLAERCRSTIADLLEVGGESSSAGADVTASGERGRRRRQAELLKLKCLPLSRDLERRQRQLDLILLRAKR